MTMSTEHVELVTTYLHQHPDSTADQVARGAGLSIRASVSALRKLMRNRQAIGLLPDEGGRVLYRLHHTKEGDLL